MIDDSDIFSIVVDRNRPQRVFAGACSGTYRSLSGGARWAKLPQSKDASYRTYTLAQDPQYENVLFAGTTQGMIKSRDGGATWQKIAPYSTRSIAFDMTRLGRIYIATDDAGILRSDDNGKTWRDANQGFCNRRLTPAGNRRKRSRLHEWKLRGAPIRCSSSSRTAARNGRAGGFPRRRDHRSLHRRGRSGTLYAAAACRGARIRDAGRVGPPRPPSPRPAHRALVAPRWESDAILAAAGSSVFISRDSAKSWTERQFPERIRSLVGARAAMDRRDCANRRFTCR